MKYLTEKQIINSLKRLEKGWPDHLMFFGGPHTLHLIKRPETSPIEVVRSFTIPASGGDPDFYVYEDK